MRLRIPALAVALAATLSVRQPASLGHPIAQNDGSPRPTDSGRGLASSDDTIARARTLPPIDICSQHAPKCPLDEAFWSGEPGAWQYTAKQWQRHTGTPSGREIIWEWSTPYGGSNEEYAGYREDHYADFTDVPTASPGFSDSQDLTYDWEVWQPAAGNFLFHQYGGSSEAESLRIGEVDCESGVYYPVVDHRVKQAWTPLCALRDGEECACGGYISAQLIQQWGPPLSKQRSAHCNDPSTGIPAEESEKGNLICKISPYVGTVHQRYVLGETASLPPSVGCEAVVYAWGWKKPKAPSQGQAHETWFRNGELRFSRWLNLSNETSDGIPEHDEEEWWRPRCERAWSGVTNAVYSGDYKIGPTRYTDAIKLPIQAEAQIAASGGHLASTIDGIRYDFPPGTFTDTVTVTHTIRFQEEFTTLAQLSGIGRFYELNAIHCDTGQPAQPSQPYTVTIEYTDGHIAAAIEGTLALYHWEGRWSRELTSAVVVEANEVRAQPTHFSLWAVLGESYRVFLPLTLKSSCSGSESRGRGRE